MKASKTIFSLTLFVLCLSSVSAWAIPVNSGFVSGSVNSDFAANMQFAGDGFSLSGFDPVRGPSIFPPSFAPDPRAAQVGSSVDLSMRVSDFGAPSDSLPVLNWQGTSYRARVDFLFASPTVIRTGSTVTTPFTFSGNVTALTGPTLVLTGQGMTTATYDADMRTIRFDFAAPPPTPARTTPTVIQPPVAAPPSDPSTKPSGTPVASPPSSPVSPPVGPPLTLADVAALPPSLLNVLRDCGMCIDVRDMGMMNSGRRGLQMTPRDGGFLSGRIVTELDPDPAGGPARLVNPEPTSWILLLTGLVWFILRRRQHPKSNLLVR